MPSLLNPPLPAGAHRRLRWHQLYGSAAALALAEATRADRRLYVVIVDAARELERLAAELRFFGAEALPLLRLPDWEVLPYDLFSPHPAVPATTHRSGLCERQPGGESRRVRSARLAAGRVPHGQRGAAAHRPLRRGDRGDPPL